MHLVVDACEKKARRHLPSGRAKRTAGGIQREPGQPGRPGGAQKCRHVRGSPQNGSEPGYLSESTQATSAVASSGWTLFGGIGTGPQAPLPPWMTLAARAPVASAWPTYLAATSLN